MDIPVNYHIKDPIQNLKVRVNVKCVSQGHGSKLRKRVDEEEEESSSSGSDSDPLEDSDDEESSSDSDDESKKKQRKKKLLRKKKKKKSKDKKKSSESTVRDWSECFTWQEKKFGPRELVKYLSNNEGSGRTAIEAEYRDQIERRMRFGEDLLHDVSRVMLFTYTDKDGFVPKNELTKFVTTSEEFVLNSVAASIVTIPETGGRSTQPNEDDLENDISSGNYGGDDEDYASLSNSRNKSHHEVSAGQRVFRESPFKVFYLMAAVDVDTERLKPTRDQEATKHESDDQPLIEKGKNPSDNRFYEVVLCTIKVNREGSVVEMQPGFSKSKYLKPCSHRMQQNQLKDNLVWYRFKTPEGSVYEYSLVNEADSSDPLLETEINTIQRENTEKVYAALEGRVSNMLLGGPPHPGSAIYSVFVEIVSVSDFVDAASDQLYVQFETHLPKNRRWSWVKNNSCDDGGNNVECEQGDCSSLRGVTQTARCRYRMKASKAYFTQNTQDNGEEVDFSRTLCAHYCFPINMRMLRTSPTTDEESILDSHEMPKMFFQVKSRDMFSRHRSEGYASLTIPSQPGSVEFNLKTWKVAGSLRQKASEFFLGGALQLDSSMYTDFPQTHSGSFLNRYGFTSETGGTVRVRVNTIVHHHVDPTVVSQLEAQAREVRHNGVNPIGSTHVVQGNTTLPGADQTRKRTVTEILNSLKYGGKFGGKSGSSSRASGSGGAQSADLMASLNRIRNRRSSIDSTKSENE